MKENLPAFVVLHFLSTHLERALREMQESALAEKNEIIARPCCKSSIQMTKN